MGRICFFPNCVPKNRDFVVFPFRRTPEFESWWKKSGWNELLSTTKLPEKILICEGHFDESLINRRYKVPRLALGALPSRNVHCPPKKKEAPKIKNDSEILLHRLFCRLCGEMQPKDLDPDEPLLKNLDEVFNNLQLSDSILLPMGVCTGCKEKVSMVQRFWKECSDVQDNLRVIFNQDHTVELVSSEIPSNISHRPFQSDISETIEAVPDADDDEDYHVFSEVLEEHQKEHTSSYEGDDIGFSKVPEASKEPENSPEPKLATDTLICEICGRVFRSRASINAHLKSHNSERQHMCGTCGKKFRQRRILMEHVQSKHENKIFPCRICGELYRWQKGLDRHMKIHKGNHLKHACNACDKIFPHPHQLKRHMMLHSGDRIYCDVCGKGYRFNYMLTQHKIREHNMQFEGVKLYTKQHPRVKTTRKRTVVVKPQEVYEVVEFTEEGASEIVELDSIAIDINPADGSEIGNEIYFEQTDETHNLAHKIE